MESEQSGAGSFAMDWSFEVEDFSPPSSLEVKAGYMEPSGPEPYQFDPLAQGADSAMSKAGAVQAIERTPSGSVTPDLSCKLGQQVLSAGQKIRRSVCPRLKAKQGDTLSHKAAA
ncbi:hypothetical protein CRENBAI_022579 [Crenichthys baileyi]|uniref:Uncharacterized protein n=1 Tax=Crenichthys baileyi TaxID=28760 RepID=A0AAV9RZI4_9TELE